MAEARTRPMYTYRTPPLPPRSEARTRMNERLSSSPRRQPGTYQRTERIAEAVAPHPLVIPPSQPRDSSEVTASPSDEDQSPVSGEGEHEYTTSSSASRGSLNYSETRILIEPSHDLQSRQSIQADPAQTPRRRKFHCYRNRTQVPLHAPQVYIPSGYPGPLATHPQRTQPVHEPTSLLPVEPRPDPSYGPSRDDIESLLNRQRAYDHTQHSLQRKNSNPLTRLTSLRREWSGSIKRTLSLGTSKRSFEPRVRETGELGRSRSVLKEGLSRSKSLFGRKEGDKRPWVGRRAHTLGARGGEARNAKAVGREDSKYEKRRGV